jgi:hypothetical protein
MGLSFAVRSFQLAAYPILSHRACLRWYITIALTTNYRAEASAIEISQKVSCPMKNPIDDSIKIDSSILPPQK